MGLLEVDHIELNRQLERAKSAYVCLLGPAVGARARARFASDVREYVRHARQHQRTEEAVLFPAAERALLPEDWRDIERAVAPAPVDAAQPAWASYHVAAE